MTKNEKALVQLLTVGQQLSNMAFNLVQWAELPRQTKESMTRLRMAWDEARLQYKHPKPKKKAKKGARE